MLSSHVQISQPDPAALDAIGNLWRASELARARGTVRSTEYPALDAQLPGGGWPRSSLTELLVRQHGIGEMRLLRPALAALATNQRIALVQPPYVPHAMAMMGWGINEQNVLWIKTERSCDALWATEQILKNGSVGAVVIWQKAFRPEALRRLNLAAQGAETWFWAVRPQYASDSSSPSPLRLSLSPALGGVDVEIVKRKGPHADGKIFIEISDMVGGKPDSSPAPLIAIPAAAPLPRKSPVLA